MTPDPVHEWLLLYKHPPNKCISFVVRLITPATLNRECARTTSPNEPTQSAIHSHSISALGGVQQAHASQAPLGGRLFGAQVDCEYEVEPSALRVLVDGAFVRRGATTCWVGEDAGDVKNGQ